MTDKLPTVANTMIEFLRCPNHLTNEGYGKLRFVGKDLIRCDLCKKEFSYKEIRQRRHEEFQFDLRDLQVSLKDDLAKLNYMNENLNTDSEMPEEPPTGE